MPDPVFLEIPLLIDKAPRRVSYYGRSFTVSKLDLKGSSGSVISVDRTVFLADP